MLSVLVFGAGAVGTYIGGSLAQAGHQTLFLERPGAAADLRRRGITVEFPHKTYTNPQPQVVDSLETALARGPFDVAIFAIKSFDTAAAADDMANRLQKQRLPPVLCLQNGVENEAVLRRALGPALVIAGTVTSAIGKIAAGHVRLERLRGVGVAAGHDLAPRLVEALSTAGLQARLYPDERSMKWSKLLTNLIANASAAILDMTPAEIFAHPGLYRLEAAQLREAIAVMKALGASVVNLPGTPIRALSTAVRFLPDAVARPILARAISRGRGGKMPSFHIDLHSGRGKSEVGFLNGAVSRFGAMNDVPTPVNTCLTEILSELTEQKISLDRFRRAPADLLKVLGLTQVG